MIALLKGFKHWKLVGLSAAFLGIAAFGGVQTFRLSSANVTIAERDATLAKKDAALVELMGAINTQNSRIEAWQTVAADRKAQSAQLLTLAKRETAERVERVTRILSEPVPTPDAECTATLELLRKYQ
jgi:hypothetical protein